ncbi:MAG: glycosyltransferase [Candidatus Omnitrophica bacterium]|nr:glycosyltransferase [Candidatus Omnitrophota bacterium]
MMFSVIIPAYNEEGRLGPALEKIRSFMDSKGYSCEVIVVTDGSTDRTPEIAQNSALSLSGRMKTLRNRQNRGKGYAVKRGVRIASGGLILVSDADLSTPIEEVEKLMALIEDGADIAIGSRASSSSDILVKQPLYRQLMGKTFNLMIRGIVGRNFRDTQCGFKLFRKEAAKDIFTRTCVRGFAFDVEVIFLALRMGYEVRDTGVKWINSRESKVHPLFSSLQMIRDIIRIKFIHR